MHQEDARGSDHQHRYRRSQLLGSESQSDSGTERNPRDDGMGRWTEWNDEGGVRDR